MPNDQVFIYIQYTSYCTSGKYIMFGLVAQSISRAAIRARCAENEEATYNITTHLKLANTMPQLRAALQMVSNYIQIMLAAPQWS